MQQNQLLQLGAIFYLPNNSPQENSKLLKYQGKVYIELSIYLNLKDGELLNKIQYQKFNVLMRDIENEFIKNLMKYQSQEDKLPMNERSQIIKIYDLVEYQGSRILLMQQGQESLQYYIQKKKEDQIFLTKQKFLNKYFVKIMQISQSIYFLHYNHKIQRDVKPENFLQNLVDIWSLGGTFYEFLTEKDQAKQTNFQNMTIKSSEQINSNVQKLLRELLQNMTQIEPQKRIIIKQVIEQLNQLELIQQLIKVPLPSQNYNIQISQSAQNKPWNIIIKKL